MFTAQHLKDLERQCTKLALLSTQLRMSVYGSEEWHRAEKELDEQYEVLRKLFVEAKRLVSPIFITNLEEGNK